MDPPKLQLRRTQSIIFRDNEILKNKNHPWHSFYFTYLYLSSLDRFHPTNKDIKKLLEGVQKG